jgi:hypothetical protein
MMRVELAEALSADDHLVRAVRALLRAVCVLSVLAIATGCHRSKPPDPVARAAEVLEKSNGDDEWARNRWMAEPTNWNLGLKDSVASKEPGSTVTVDTIRDLATEDLASCLPKGTAAPVYFRTAITLAKSGKNPVLAIFHWPALDSATAGHKQVQAAVTTAQGDEAKLWETIQHEPSLEKACVMFAGKRDLCRGGEAK